jgi:membrane fusion protein (multidrug efflux system)
MSSSIGKYGFAAGVLALVGLAVVAVAGKSLTADKPGGGPSSGPPAAQAAAGGGAGGGRGGGPGGGGGATQVIAEQVAPFEFSDAIQALGSAQARESVVITSKVTDVIRAIRFESGDRVSKGQVLVVLSNVEQQADLQEANASLEVERREFERFRDLGEKGFAPKARVEEAQAAFDRAQARVAALQARIADRTIRAPFSGVMGLRTASPGALARPGEPIATLDDVSVIKLDFDVAEPQLPQVQKGVSITARAAAFPDREFKGEVDQLDSRLNAQTGTARVRALIPNKDGALKPGMRMTVEIRSNPRSALAISEMSVVERTDGAYVFRVEEKEGAKVASLAKVVLGQRSQGRIEVVSGLAAGDQVVVEGVQRVRPGQPVRLRDAEVKDGGKERPPGPTAGPTAAAAGSRS